MASLLSQSVNVASNLYSTAMSSLTTIPTLLPAAPASPIDFSSYTIQILNSPFQKPLIFLPSITLPLPNLTFWQVANILFFIFTVAILSWMLDSHHTDDEDELSSSQPAVIPNTVEILTPPPPRAAAHRSLQRRRQTLETIATFVNLEDIHRASARKRRRSLRTPLPCSLFNSPVENNNTNNFNITTPTSPTEVQGQLISTPLGKGKSLLRKASETSSCSNRRRWSFQDEVVRKGLEVVADYDRVARVSTEEAERRRSGTWKTGLLLGLRVPVGWTMK